MSILWLRIQNTQFFNSQRFSPKNFSSPIRLEMCFWVKIGRKIRFWYRHKILEPSFMHFLAKIGFSGFCQRKHAEIYEWLDAKIGGVQNTWNLEVLWLLLEVLKHVSGSKFDDKQDKDSFRNDWARHRCVNWDLKNF